jgi:hypothetical protein
VAGDQAAKADQQKRNERRQHGEPEQPRVEFVLRVDAHLKKPAAFLKTQRAPQLKFILPQRPEN